MSARLTRVFETDPLAAEVAPDLRAFVALAVKVTARPGDVSPADIRAAFDAAASPRQFYDAAGVMVAFNFITRVANALGVKPEIPGWMRRVEPLRRVGLRAMGLFFRMFVDLGPKAAGGPPAAEHLAGFRTLFADLRLGGVPAWVERLAFAPPLLAALREFLEALVRRGGGAGTVAVDPDQFLAIGRVVLRSVPNAVTLAALAADREPAPHRTEVEARRAALVARLANDVATHSYKVTQERIDELRAAGLDDADVLDVVATAALWCAAARLEVLTGCLPVLPTDDRQTRQEAAHLAGRA
jgi:alkylhydroperoxidase family enzyme